MGAAQITQAFLPGKENQKREDSPLSALIEHDLVYNENYRTVCCRC